MFDNFRIPPELIPIGFFSFLAATLRALIVGRQSVRVALMTWPVALLSGLLGGWIVQDSGAASWWGLLAAGAAAIMGENLVKGLDELASQFRDDPDGTIERLLSLFRRGG